MACVLWGQVKGTESFWEKARQRQALAPLKRHNLTYDNIRYQAFPKVEGDSKGSVHYLES
eukprot:5400774-Heterocapsa_arctica.AAC.1